MMVTEEVKAAKSVKEVSTAMVITGPLWEGRVVARDAMSASSMMVARAAMVPRAVMAERADTLGGWGQARPPIQNPLVLTTVL